MVIKYGAAPKRFQSKWDTTQAGSANDTVVLPLVSDGSYNFRIDWGDGKSNRDNITVYNQSEVTHQYDDTGIYTIKVVGDITGWQFNHAGDDDKIIEISKWGPLRFADNDEDNFGGCSNLVLTATDSLTLANTAKEMFNNSPVLGNQGNMSTWNTSNVTNMNAMFHVYAGGSTFDQDIGNWDLSSCTDIQQMFRGEIGDNAFNNGGSPSISGLDTSNVI